MDLISDSSLCETLGFDLDAEFGNVRRYSKTAIKNIMYDIQTSLDDLAGETLEPLENITDKINDSVKDMLGVIADSPFGSAAQAILNCIGVHTIYASLRLIDWKSILDHWLMEILTTFLSDPERALWAYLKELENAFSPYTFDKIMALAACLIGCPGVSGATTPGPDGWGVITPQGWVYTTESEFTDLVNTIGLGVDAKVDFSLFGASGSTYGSRIRTIQDNGTKAINALAAVATGTVAPDDDSQQVITNYDNLILDVEDAYEIYLGINEDILEVLRLASADIREVEIYRKKVYKLGNSSYRGVADNAIVKMVSIYSDVESYRSSAFANNAAALAAHDDLDLSSLETLNLTNTGYKDSAIVDKNRIKRLQNIVRGMANALENKGIIEGEYSAGIKARGREAVKPASGIGSYQADVDAV